MFGLGSAEDESSDELVEDDPIGNSSPVASEGVTVVDRGQKIGSKEGPSLKIKVLARRSCPYVFDCDVCTSSEANASPSQSVATCRVQDTHTPRLSAQPFSQASTALPYVAGDASADNV